MNQECLLHAAKDDWSATFSPAIPGLLWYGQNTRGLSGTQNNQPTDYTFNVPFEILSGFSQSTINGMTLSLPPGQYQSGILRFLAPVSNLTCSTTCTEPNDQLCTFGQLNIDFGSNYCSTAVPNSTGVGTVISAAGSDFAGDNFMTLVASSMPSNATGLFITSLTQNFVAMPGGSSGNLCLGGAIGRYVDSGQIMNSGGAGRIELAIDLAQHPTPNGLVTVTAGDTWNFQAWHRDVVGGVVTSNFSSGLSITFR